MSLTLNIKIHIKRFFIVSPPTATKKQKKTEIKYLNFLLQSIVKYIPTCAQEKFNIPSRQRRREIYDKSFSFPVNNLSCQFMRVTNSYFSVLYFHLPCYVS